MPSDFCWLSTVSGTGVYNQGILLAAIPGYAIYFLPELFGIPSPGSLGVSLRMAIHELDIDRNFGLHNWKCGSWTCESKKEKKTPESKGVTSTPPS